MKPSEVLITGIGSLPHHNVDAALAYSFRHSLPFLPQIPIRNPREFMIVQALDGLPGLAANDSEDTRVDKDVWDRHAGAFTAELEKAFIDGDFERYDPTNETWKSWTPFLWELKERNQEVAKIQIAGPLTCQWALRLTDGTPVDRFPEIGTAILRLTLARSIAMVRRLEELDVQPILYLDEPALYCYSAQNPRHVMALKELKLCIQTLQKEKAEVGLHCCSNTDWQAVLDLNLNYVSIDVRLSLLNLLAHAEGVLKFLSSGGRFSLGIVPTGLDSKDIATIAPKKLLDDLVNILKAGEFIDPTLQKKILRESIYTAACGLALHNVEDCEVVLRLLKELIIAE